MQMGFDLVYTDPVTQKTVDWAVPTPQLLADIAAARWKVTDIETTGLTPHSKELEFSGKELRRGVNPTLRLRVATVYYPSSQYPCANGLHLVGFDFDQLTAAERSQVCAAIMTNVVFGHNIGFDAYWLQALCDGQMPEKLLDSMLLARALRPDVPLVLAKMCNDESEEPEFKSAAEGVFQQGRSGWSLADLAMVLLRKILPKDMQGPKNWCQPFLTQAAFGYATDDSKTTYELLMKLFEDFDGDDLLEKYEAARAASNTVRMFEPQVGDIVRMRRHGMPWSSEAAEKYAQSKADMVLKYAQQMTEIEPALSKYLSALGNVEEGVKAELRAAMGDAFRARGLDLATTEKTGLPMVGEKDLRKAKAQEIEAAVPLFDAWVKLSKAKKARQMALEVTKFALRSTDRRIHSLTSHGPVTGRLASKEPNSQQWPSAQDFRDCAHAEEGHKIMACDYSALDMRVGAALAIRAQKEIAECYMGSRECDPEALQAISRVLEGRVTTELAVREEAMAIKRFTDWKAKIDSVSDTANARKAFWEEYRSRNRRMLLARFTRCYSAVRDRARAAGTAEWGSLRDAFNIPGMDIHSWTAMGMLGRDPAAEFQGLDNDAVAKRLKAVKKELGDSRKTGKVGNLSLLYAMKTLGLMEAAAKNYNIHWKFEEADQVRNQWLATYIEIDLWHAWREMTPLDTAYVPDPDRGGRYVKKVVYDCRTLGDRMIYAFGLNAALSYEDQSTGADILGRFMDQLHKRHPKVFDTTSNQVHDEVVFHIPDEHVEGYTKIVQDLMVECAEHFTMPFGVHVECSPAIGDVWVKD